MKKLIILFTMLFLAIPVQAKIVDLVNCQKTKRIYIHKISYGCETSTYPITKLDPNVQGSYPGGRGPNELVIYTDRFGLKTGTNEFGKEAVVKGSTVTKVNSMDSVIPRRGFVVSGHGKAKDWIERNIIVGAKVRINGDTVTSTITPKSYIYQAEQKISDAKEIVHYCRQQGASTATANQYLNKAKTSLKQAKKSSRKSITTTKRYAKNAIIYSNKAIENAVPYLASEIKGIWVRPVERSPIEICNTLNRLKRDGINNVFVETFYHGVTIFPSSTLKQYNLPSQRPEFRHFDPLRVWVNEAHKRGIKVHAWFQTFYIGNTKVSPSVNTFIRKHPDWINRQRLAAKATTPPPSKKEHDGYFLDPANPQVQKFAMALLKEIVSKYNVDGVNIDYIRYPACENSNSSAFVESNWGYTAYAMNEFKKLHGISPIKLTTSSSQWSTWERYRQRKVTDFVKKLKSLKGIRPNITISTVIFPDKAQSGTLKLQDWSTWTHGCYVDAVTPLFLTSNTELTAKLMRAMRATTGTRVKIYTGLFEPFTNGDPTDLLRQIKVARENGSKGVIIFDYAHFRTKYEEALKTRAFKK